jgi:hypothetical protein
VSGLGSTVIRMDMDWNRYLSEQLDWQWNAALRPRLAGLTDDEYFWEPVAGCWSVRPRAQSKAPITFGGGEYVFEYARPEPTPPPVTTIAWRLAHVIVGCLGQRTASHFGGPEMPWSDVTFAGTAKDALARLDEAYAGWIAGVRGLGADGLARRCGPAEGPYADASLAELVLHINREVIHHGAEMALLRDLYRDR